MTKARDVWKHLIAADTWSRRRIAGETVLALVLALLMVLGQWSEGAPRAVVAAVAVAMVSLLRRAFPASVLVLTAALAGAVNSFWAVLMVVAWSAGSRIEARRRPLALLMASYVLYAGLSVLQETFPLSVLETLLFSTLSFLATVVVPALASRYRTQRRTLLHALHEHNAQLLREREMIASHSRLRERQRIAQDMHDSLGHQLALIAVHTGALEVGPDLTDDQRQAVGVLREASVAAMHELREAVGILRDGTPEQAPEREGGPEPAARGVAGIEGLVAASRGTRAVVELRRAGEARPLAPAADHAAYRIVQEALTNALKHAPGASTAVELRYEPDSLVVEVANGPVPATTGGGRRTVVSGGHGLTGLQERARLVGGMVHAGSTADGGFRVAAVLPYGPRAPHASDGSRRRSDSGREVTTFVDAANDFRGQSEGAVPGDGGADIDWSGPPDRQKELDIAMGRKKKGVAIGCGIAVLAVVVVGVGALVVGLYFWAGKEADKVMINPSVYNSVQVGDAETAVRDKLPRGKSFLAEGLVEEGPAVPAGAACSSYLSTEDGPAKGGKEPAYRFCFKGGKLIEKTAYMVES
ncbi:sensor histidine kinase [Streptomyces sp. NBC_00878]|uniref:sensor histidine kinase n=1 Tax=Streptomyces sp. NBC_00878 TaxID=2975854 RepID=UPI002254FAFF|nr:histidine kinase [Streptomyces sp. NBC_00878]MCX4903733.1 histidine kinase [Streptomyces sp. NBC_00878]